MRICGGTRGPLRVAAYPSPGFREQRDFEFARIGPSDHSGTQYACSGHSGKKRKDVRGRSQSPPAFNPSAIPESVALTLSGHCRPVARFLCASATMLRVRSALWLALPVISRTSHLVSTEGYFEHPCRAGRRLSRACHRPRHRPSSQNAAILQGRERDTAIARRHVAELAGRGGYSYIKGRFVVGPARGRTGQARSRRRSPRRGLI